MYWESTRVIPSIIFSTSAATRGSAQVLEAMFQHPLTDAEMINQRTAVLKFFQQGGFTFPVMKELCEKVEQYLGMAGNTSVAGTALKMLRNEGDAPDCNRQRA